LFLRTNIIAYLVPTSFALVVFLKVLSDVTMKIKSFGKSFKVKYLTGHH